MLTIRCAHWLLLNPNSSDCCSINRASMSISVTMFCWPSVPTRNSCRLMRLSACLLLLTGGGASRLIPIKSRFSIRAKCPCRSAIYLEEVLAPFRVLRDAVDDRPINRAPTKPEWPNGKSGLNNEIVSCRVLRYQMTGQYLRHGCGWRGQVQPAHRAKWRCRCRGFARSGLSPFL